MYIRLLHNTVIMVSPAILMLSSRRVHGKGLSAIDPEFRGRMSGCARSPTCVSVQPRVRKPEGSLRRDCKKGAGRSVICSGNCEDSAANFAAGRLIVYFVGVAKIGEIRQ